MAHALLATVALTSVAAVAAAPPGDGIVLTPDYPGATAVANGGSVTVSGQVELAGTSFIQQARLVGYDATGEAVVEQAVVFNLNRTEAQANGDAFLDVDPDGNVTGRIVTECAFGDATSAPGDAAYPACSGQTTTAWDLQLEIVLGDNSLHRSDAVRNDPIPPVVESYVVVDPNTIVATFSEPVTHPTGTESTSDWVFRDGEAVVVGIEAGTDDCDYAADEDARAGTSGCTRILTIAPALPADATPRIDYFPRARGVHVDGAGNTVYIRSVPLADGSRSRGQNADSLAWDRVGPAAPTIDSIDGTDAVDPDTGERLVLGNEPQPDVVVTDVADGQAVAVQVDDVEAGTGTASGTSATVGLDGPLADGVHQFTATSADTALCNPNDPSAGTCPNPSEPSVVVTYDLDTVAPEPLGDALARSGSVTVAFTEPVTGTDDAGQWSIDNGAGAPMTVTAVTDDGDGSDVRRLSVAGGPVLPGATLTWTAPGSGAYQDDHGNQALTFTIPLVAAPLPVISLATAPGDETPTGVFSATSPVTFSVNLSEPVAIGETVSVSYRLLPLGTATIGSDVTDTSGTLTFTSGQSTADVDVAVLQDALDEFDESVVLELHDPAGGQFAGGGTTLRGIDVITDDDPLAVASFAEASVEVVEGDGRTITVELDTVSGKPVRVDWATTLDGSASAADVADQTGTLEIPAGATSATFEVTTLPDLDVEDGELFGIELSAPSNADIGGGRLDVTIIDDDVLVPEITITGGSVDEDAVGPIFLIDPGVLEFRVELSSPVQVPVSVDYATTTGGTATASADFTGTSGTLEFEPGDTVLLVEVEIADDQVDEEDETVEVELTNPSGATLAGGVGNLTALGTIVDDDPLALVAFASDSEAVAVNEGEEATFTVELDTVSAKDVLVDWATDFDGTAFPADAPAQSGQVTIPAGATSATFTVATTDDAITEEDEDLGIVLSSPVNATLDAGRVTAARLTIADDELGLPTITVSTPSVPETEGFFGPLSPAQLVYSVTLSQVPRTEVRVDFRTASGGSATQEADYRATSGTLTIPAGETSASITVDVVDDDLDEFDETVALVLSNPVGARLAGGASTDVALGTITDDDPLAIVSLGDDVSVDEGEPAEFQVSLDAPSGKDITIAYTTTDDSAVAGEDYAGTSGELTIQAGSTTGTFSVPTTDDADVEGDESLAVDIAVVDPDTAALGDGAAVLTIVDNDLPVDPDAAVVSLSGAVTEEGDPFGPSIVLLPTNSLDFAVSLNRPADGPVTLDYTTTPGTATDGEDYEGVTSSVTIPDGEDATTISVGVFVDALDEADETVLLTITGVTGSAVLPAAGLTRTGRILDDDPLPEVAFAANSVDVGVAEGGSVELTVELDTVSGRDVAVDWRTSYDGSADESDAPAQSGTVLIPAGATTATLTVDTTQDAQDEPDEDFSVALLDPVAASLAGDDATARVVIDDDDVVLPIISIVGGSTDEGAAGPLAFLDPATVTWQVTLSEAAGEDVQVDFTTIDSGTAVAGSDYDGVGGTLTIPAGETSATIEADIIDDDLDEFDEDVVLRLSNPVGAVLSNGGPRLVAAATIVDDDPLAIVSLGEDVEVAEGDPAALAITLDAPSGKTITLRYRTVAGSASAGSDFPATTRTVTIAAGATSASIALATLDDSVAEGDETFDVVLEVVEADTAALDRNRATVTILDDDLGVDPNATVVALSGAVVEEGNPVLGVPLPLPGNTLDFAVRLSRPAEGDVTVTYDTAGITATEDQDYEGATGQVTIPDGQDSATISVPVTGDTLDEDDETMRMRIVRTSNNAQLPAGGLDRQGRILDDDDPVGIRVADATVLEGDTAVMTVTLSAASGRTVSIDYAVADGTATVGDDLEAVSGTLSFPPGVTSASVSVATYDDGITELFEQARFLLSTPVNGAVQDGEATITLVDLDGPGAVFLEDASVLEADSPTTARIPVRLSSPQPTDVTATWTTQQLSATPGDDYEPEGGEVTVPAGSSVAYIEVPIVGDDEIEANEEFLVVLTGADAFVSGPTSRVTIIDDDAEGGPPPGGGDDDDVDGSPDGGGGQLPDRGELPATGGGAGLAALLLMGAGGLLRQRRRLG